MTTDLLPDADANSGTGSGLIAFLGFLIEKNLMVDTTASALRTGCQKILSVEADGDEINIRTLDVDDLIQRFRNKHRAGMKAQELS